MTDLKWLGVAVGPTGKKHLHLRAKFGLHNETLLISSEGVREFLTPKTTDVRRVDRALQVDPW